MIEFWVVLTGVLVGITCSIAGVFLVLRKMSMIADAISHTVLFGIVISFIVTQTLSGVTMFIGAALAGLLTAFLVQYLRSNGIQEDAAIGIIFTTLFAISVLLITLFAGDVHLDVEHVLMGEIAFVPWDKLTLFGIEMPKAVWMLGSALLINIIILTLFFKQFKLSTFDPVYAASIGLPIVFMHYLFMLMISMTTVSAFDSVGAILVIAMLIGPAATAYLISRSLKQMFAYAISFGVMAAIGGYYVAKWFDTSIAGMMAVMIGIIFIVVLSSQIIRRIFIKSRLSAN
ncbi:metal ABC transporter permease [Solibacillus sp. FSL K6-4121]|uniref:metal ABC transporter permease n=1 Tax=Solibacillus sp. FSL K6-4121 TaxID=2921505 RepID=UPI0030F61DB4